MIFKKKFFNSDYKFCNLVILITLTLFQIKVNAQNIDSIKFVLKNSSSKSEKAAIYNDLANEYLNIDLNLSRNYTDSAISIAKQTNNFKVLSNAYVNFANAFYYEGNLDSTLYFYQKSYNEIIKVGDNNETAASLNRLGLIYEAKSNYSEAIHHYSQALKIYEATNHYPGLANVYNNLGVVNDINGNTQKSIDFYTKALNTFQKSEDLHGQANVYNNLATLYFDKNEIPKAISYIHTAIKILKQNNSRSETATAYYNASTFYDIKQKPDSARLMLDSALVYYQFSNNLHGISNVLDKEAVYLANNLQYSEAITQLQKSLTLRDQVGNLNAKVKTLELLSSTFEKLGDFENALKYYKEQTILNDSVFNDNTKKVISELNIKYESIEKDKAISLLQKESQIQESQNKLLFFLSIAFCFIAILMFYAFRTKSKYIKSQKEAIKHRTALTKLETEKQETEKYLLEKEIKTQQKINDLQKKELESSKRELATSAIQILNKNKILSEIKTSISNINPSKADERKVVDKISKRVMDNINLDEDWEQFKIHFEKVNTNFFENLQRENPKLTAGDLRVCAYIKINLSTKEMAQMMSISLDGINKRLYRIRKKIKLPPDTNLNLFLSKY